MRLQIEGSGIALGGRRVLHETSLEFAEGRVTAVMGPNGAAKSTLLRCLAGLLPFEGAVRAGGQAVGELPRREAARRIGYLPQGADLPFPFEVEDVVRTGRHPWVGRLGRFAERDREAVRRAEESAAVTGLRGRRVDELSGGERRRVLLARTLAAETPILLLDEPTSDLDVRHALEFCDLLRGLAREGRTVVLAIHDLNLAARTADRFVLLREGRVAADSDALDPGTIEAVFEVRARRGEDGVWSFSRVKP